MTQDDAESKWILEGLDFASRLRAALEKIEECERYTRSGGATVDDLSDYEDGLQEALQIARAALSEPPPRTIEAEAKLRREGGEHE